MEEIIEKDISDLKSKVKQFKIVLKRTLLGVISATLVFSTAPNIEYQIALNKANNSSYIEKVLSSNDKTKEDKISQIFTQAIENNDKIPHDLKARVIEAFTEEVIDRAGSFFTDKTIKNMYAVASTQKIEEMLEFSVEHGWWSGSYRSYFNTYSIDTTTKEPSSTLIAHEQLHAIVKTGLIDTGFTNFIYNGYGINEGTTALVGKNDNSYFQENNIVDTLGMIIGYDTLFKYYMQGDLRGLKKELNQYISPQETNTFIRNLDLNVFTGFFETFLLKNNIPYDSEKLSKTINTRNKKIIETLKVIFENKYSTSIEESKFGNLIFNNTFFIPDEEYDPSKTYYSISFNNENTVKLNISNYDLDNGVCKFIINKSVNQLSGQDIEYLIAKELNVYGIEGYSIKYLNKNESEIVVSGISVIVNTDQIENYDYEKLIRDLSNIKKVNIQRIIDENDNVR